MVVKIWIKSYSPNYTKFWAFWQKQNKTKQKTGSLKPFWESVDAILERRFCSWNNCLILTINFQTTIFQGSKKYGSPTRVTILKVVPNMGDLISIKDWDSHLNAGFRLACRPSLCRYVAWWPLAVSWLKLSAATPLWLITERHRPRVALKSTVCDLPRWAKRQGYRFIGKTLFAAWSSLWVKCSGVCTVIQISSSNQKSGERQTSLKAA